MPWHLPREQSRRLLAAAGIAGLAFVAQGPMSTAASFTGSSTAASSQFRTSTWCSNHNAYPDAVLATSPSPRNFLHLDDTGATTTVVDSAPGAPNGVRAGSAAVFGQPGLLDCLPTTAVQLSNATQPTIRTGGPGIASPGPNVFTITAWVDVVSGQGRLVGLGRTNAAGTTVTNNNNDDRMIYIDSGGYLRFGISDNTAGGVPNGRYTIRSNVPITGDRHHVAVTLGPAGMQMYVDGVRQTDQNPAVMLGRSGYNGSWRVGYDLLTTAWPGVTTASTLPVATVDEVAIWHDELNVTQILTLATSNHY